MDVFTLKLGHDVIPRIRKHGLCRILQHHRCEARLGGVFRRRPHAVIERQPDYVHIRHARVPQQPRQPAVRLTKRIPKSGIHFAVHARALVEHAVQTRGVELGDQLGAGGVRDAVRRPERRGVLPPRDTGRGGRVLGDCVGRGVGGRVPVGGGKGDVVGRVPVASGDFEGKGETEEGVDDGGDGAAVLDGEGTVLEGGRRVG